MADLSDDLGDFTSRELRELIMDLFRSWRQNRRWERGEQVEQRKIANGLEVASRRNPTDPAVAISFEPVASPPLPDRHLAAEFLSVLQQRGYNNVSLLDKDTIAVPQSVAAGVIELAELTGYKERQRDPMQRKLVVVECDSREACAEAADAMRAQGWDVEQGRGTVSPTRLVCMVGAAEVPEFTFSLSALHIPQDKILSNEDVLTEQALEADLEASREEASRTAVKGEAEPGAHEVVADGEVHSVSTTEREHPETGPGEDALDEPGGPDDEGPAEREENDPLAKQQADAEGWLREQRSGRQAERGEVSRAEEVR